MAGSGMWRCSARCCVASGGRRSGTRTRGRLFDDVEGMVEGEEGQEGDRQAKVDRA